MKCLHYTTISRRPLCSVANCLCDGALPAYISFRNLWCQALGRNLWCQALGRTSFLPRFPLVSATYPPRGRREPPPETDSQVGMSKIVHLGQLKSEEYFKDSGLTCIVREMHDASSNETIAMHDHDFSELVLVASRDDLPPARRDRVPHRLLRRKPPFPRPRRAQARYLRRKQMRLMIWSKLSAPESISMAILRYRHLTGAVSKRGKRTASFSVVTSASAPMSAVRLSA